MERGDNALLLHGWTFTGDRELVRRLIDPTQALDGQLDLPLRAELVSALLARTKPMTDLASFLDTNDGYYGSSALMGVLLGNHDTVRAIHYAGDTPLSDPWAPGQARAWVDSPAPPAGMSAFERLAAAFSIVLTLPGLPFIYYGDEIGLPGAGDPDNRRMMQWTGYSAGQSFLLDHVKKLGALRSQHTALRRGSRTTISSSVPALSRPPTAPRSRVITLDRAALTRAQAGGATTTPGDLKTQRSTSAWRSTGPSFESAWSNGEDYPSSSRRSFKPTSTAGAWRQAASSPSTCWCGFAQRYHHPGST